MTVKQGDGDAVSRILEEIQKDLPEVDRPFKEIASRCGIDETEAINIIVTQCKDNIIREISAIIDARKIGFHSTLVAVSVPDNLLEITARRISAHPGVSHNYQRNHIHNIWFTIAVPRERDLADEVEALVGPGQGVSYLLLPTVTTYKLRVHLSIGTGGRKKKKSSGYRSAGTWTGI